MRCIISPFGQLLRCCRSNRLFQTWSAFVMMVVAGILRTVYLMGPLLLLIAVLPINGFFFGRSNIKPDSAQWYSIRDYNMPIQSAYSYDTVGGMTVAVPVAVPIQQQKLAPAAATYGTGAPVQLVPCLCPISRDPNVKSPPSPSNAIPAPAPVSSGPTPTVKQ